MRILCLHGSGSSGEKFRANIKPLIDQIQLDIPSEWVFPTAPHLINQESEVKGYAWWKLPTGKRSYNAKEYFGVEESLQIIENHAPYEVILAHSQGSMIAAILSAHYITQSIPKPSPLKLVLSGAAWPNAYSSLLEAAATTLQKYKESSSIDPRARNSSPWIKSLHVLSEEDSVNPPIHGIRLSECLDGEVCWHSGGHVFPRDHPLITSKIIQLLK